MASKAAREYGIQWREFNKSDRLVTKKRFFATRAQRDSYADKVEEKASFAEFVAWSDPRD